MALEECNFRALTDVTSRTGLEEGIGQTQRTHICNIQDSNRVKSSRVAVATTVSVDDLSIQATWNEALGVLVPPAALQRRDVTLGLSSNSLQHY